MGNRLLCCLIYPYAATAFDTVCRKKLYAKRVPIFRRFVKKNPLRKGSFFEFQKVLFHISSISQLRKTKHPQKWFCRCFDFVFSSLQRLKNITRSQQKIDGIADCGNTTGREHIEIADRIVGGQNSQCRYGMSHNPAAQSHPLSLHFAYRNTNNSQFQPKLSNKKPGLPNGRPGRVWN